MRTKMLKEKIEESRQRLAVAEKELESAMLVLTSEKGGEKTVVAKQLEGAFNKLRDARRHLGDLNEILDSDPGESSAPQRDCPACGKRIMAAATLCGYCWTKLT